MGINVNLVIALTFFVGSLLASIAGTMYGMYYEAIDPLMGSVISMKTFACVVLGGVGVLPGAMLGGSGDRRGRSGRRKLYQLGLP